jgi:hypothetical protein
MRRFGSFLRSSIRLLAVLISLALSGFICIAAGYLLGWNTVSLRSSAPHEIRQIAGASESEAAGFFANPGQGRRGSQTARDAKGPGIAVRILRIAANMRPGIDDRETRSLAIAEIASLDAGEIREAMDALQKAPMNTPYHRLRMALLDRWVRLEPNAAFEFARTEMVSASGMLRRESIEDILLNVWASHDPLGALEKWRSLPEDARASAYRTGRIVGEVAANDFALGLNTLESLPPKYHYESLRAMARAPSNEGEREILFERAAKLPKMKERAKIVATQLQDWARRTDRGTVEEWIDQSDLPRQERNEIEDDLGRLWFYENHKDSAEWLISRAETPERRSEVLRDIASIWGQHDPASAGEWLNTQPLDQTMNRAMEVFADRIARHYPEDAVAWANAIPDEAAKKNAFTRISNTIDRHYPHLSNQLLPQR